MPDSSSDPAAVRSPRRCAGVGVDPSRAVGRAGSRARRPPGLLALRSTRCRRCVAGARGRAAARAPGALALGVRTEAPSARSPTRPRSRRAPLHDQHPPSVRRCGLPRALALRRGRVGEALPACGRSRAASALRARRGALEAALARRCGGRARRRSRVVRVSQLRRARAVHAARHRQPASQIGVLHGAGAARASEFHQLREYRQGDRSAQIDWKATARRRLISREYQEERDQQRGAS